MKKKDTTDFSPSRYEVLGASATKSGLHASLKKSGRENETGFFATLNADIAGDENYYSFLHCDGAGTKSIVAYLMFRETGVVDHFKGLAQDALVMNVDDMFCVGPVESLVLANTIAKNAKLISDEAVGALIESYTEIANELAALGIPITLSGGETADMGDVVRTLVVDAVLCGRLKKDRAINTTRIAAGDVIVGLSSTGKTTYEKAANSGIASNGLTLARHSLLTREYLRRFPEIGTLEMDVNVSYVGPYKVTDLAPGLATSVGEALLSPTRSYAPILAQVYNELGLEVHGVIHLTGGGQTKPLRFGKNVHYKKNNLFPIPQIFKLIEEHGSVARREMYQVFNMGHRIEIMTAEKNAKKIESIAKGFGVEAKIIGLVEESQQGNRVTVEVGTEKHEYQL